jgi:Sulfotransferase domain
MSREICIVSGLPRSGTSLMMQMLEAGGMEVAIDYIRRADEDNPKGYYELEVVKRIKEDTSWLDGMAGKVFKIVSMLLYYLPHDRYYKIIFMRRKMEEILASQHVMLLRQGKTPKTEQEADIRTLFEQHLQHVCHWLADQGNMEVCYVCYDDLLQQPSEAVTPLAKLLGRSLNTQRMAHVVDASLYRQRRRTR